jgi:haloacetate dehalogenase
MHWFENFEVRDFDTQGARIHARVSPGLPEDRQVLLLLHGFPQTHVMWHRVAQRLQKDFYLVMPDLRGYGDSSKAPGLADHSNYSKRAMAQDKVDVMDALGVAQFDLCGHDRGGRVAHRLALDHPTRVRRLCVIDIAPSLDMYAATDFTFASAYYHWFHLIQPTPLPETMINAKLLAYLHAKLGGWGSANMDYIEPAALAEYERCFSNPATIHAMCEDYRASRALQAQNSEQSGGKVACDTLVLWGERGGVSRLFKPLQLWQAQCVGKVTGHILPAGHFIPEELPSETAALLGQFLEASKS